MTALFERSIDPPEPFHCCTCNDCPTTRDYQRLRGTLDTVQRDTSNLMDVLERAVEGLSYRQITDADQERIEDARNRLNDAEVLLIEALRGIPTEAECDDYSRGTCEKCVREWAI